MISLSTHILFKLSAYNILSSVICKTFRYVINTYYRKEASEEIGKESIDRKNENLSINSDNNQQSQLPDKNNKEVINKNNIIHNNNTINQERNSELKKRYLDRKSINKQKEEYLNKHKYSKLS